jgi:hypothetical protein
MVGVLAAGALALALPGCTGDPAPVPSAAPSRPAAAPSGPLLEETVLAGGMTEVVADPAFLDTLDRLGVVPRVTGEAGFAGATGTFSFPVTEGSVAVGPDRVLRGQVRHEGSGLRLTTGTATAALDELVLDADAGVVTATVSVAGAVQAEDAPLLIVDPSGLEVGTGRGGATELRGLRLGLTAQGAELLNAALAPAGFVPGAPVGSATLTLG